MEVLLREFRGPRGNEYADRLLSVDVISLGRAPDCLIQLSGLDIAAHHARVRQARGRIVLAVRRGGSVRVNEKVIGRHAHIEVGDEIRIGGWRITATAPPEGFDLALAVLPPAAGQQADPQSSFVVRLDQTWLSRRQLSWLLVLLIPLLTFVIPLQTAQLRSVATPATLTSRPISWLPDDSWWTAGPLSPAHALRFNGQCRACHRDFFVRVRDEDCQSCHKGISDDHVTAQHRALTALASSARPCRSCHEEHKSDRGSIIVRDNSLCLACHVRSNEWSGKLRVAKVSGFSEARPHPPFAATVLSPTAGTASSVAQVSSEPPAAGIVPTIWQLLRVPVMNGSQQTNLREYDHTIHLDPTRMYGRKLGCADCHVPGLDGQHFTPVTMAANCMENCHELKVGDDRTARPLPHGKPHDAVTAIEDYYALKYSDPRAAAPAQQRRRLPDKPEPEDRCRGLLGPALGKCGAIAEVEAQFNTIGCGKCHVVDDRGSSLPLEDRFAVRPVRFTPDYFPRASFSHRQHTIQDGKTGDAACLSCHAADRSTDISRLMLPDQDHCLQCHSDQSTEKRVQLDCTSCHAYHLHRTS
jgi:predicted CXXCH cytochrome family protein